MESTTVGSMPAESLAPASSSAIRRHQASWSSSAINLRRSNVAWGIDCRVLSMDSLVLSLVPAEVRMEMLLLFEKIRGHILVDVFKQTLERRLRSLLRCLQSLHQHHHDRSAPKQGGKIRTAIETHERNSQKSPVHHQAKSSATSTTSGLCVGICTGRSHLGHN